MNFLGAEKFAARIKAKYSIPIHIGMFDELSAENLEIGNKIVPKIYHSLITQ